MTQENSSKDNEKRAGIPHATTPQVRKQIAERAAVGPWVVHEAIRKEGEEELSRCTSALAWSGLAAGLSMGFSLVAEGMLVAHLPDAPWRPLIAKLGYAVGFLIVILGRQQLFTENTVTVIIPLLHSRKLETLYNVLRLWATVLLTNLVGAFLFAWVLGNTQAFPPEYRTAFADVGKRAMPHGGFGVVLMRGIFAGWLIALMVWLLPAAQHSKISVIIIVTYVVALGQLTHIIAGSVEVLYLVVTDSLPWATYLGGYMLPTLLGNIIGGTALVAALNHAQVVSGYRCSV